MPSEPPTSSGPTSPGPTSPSRRPPAGISPAHLAATADDRAHRAHLARLLRRRGRARRRTMGRVQPQPGRARRRGARPIGDARPTSSCPGETRPPPGPDAPDDHHRADVPACRSGGQELPHHRRRQQLVRRSRLAVRRGVRRPHQLRRAQRHDHGVAGRSRRPTRSPCSRSRATCTSRSTAGARRGSTPPTAATTRRGCRTRSS